MDNPDIEYDRIKTAIMELAELKYECCSYNDVPQKNALLKEIMEGVKRLNTLDVELLSG